MWCKYVHYVTGKRIDKSNLSFTFHLIKLNSANSCPSDGWLCTKNLTTLVLNLTFWRCLCQSYYLLSISTLNLELKAFNPRFHLVVYKNILTFQKKALLIKIRL